MYDSPEGQPKRVKHYRQRSKFNVSYMAINIMCWPYNITLTVTTKTSFY